MAPPIKQARKGRRKRYSDEELLDILRRIGEELEAPPRMADVDGISKQGVSPRASNFYTRFGSFRAALRKAGFKPTPREPGFRFSREKMVGDLQTLEIKLGRLPFSEDIRKAGNRGECTSWVTYLKRFGTLEGVRRAAGLPLPATREKMLEALRRLATPEGHAPEKTTIMAANHRGECDRVEVYRTVFGSLEAAYDEARLKPRVREPHVLTREQLIEDLQRYAAELGHTPSATEWVEGTRQRKLQTYIVYNRHFGGMRQARTAAGLPPIVHRGRRNPEELLEGLRLLARDVGHAPREVEIKEGSRRGICAVPSTYRHHFGGIRQACAAAGLDPVGRCSRGFRGVRKPGDTEARKAAAREAYLEDLRRLSTELGRTPSNGDVFEGARRGVCAHPMTYRNRFGGIQQAREAAGLPPIENRRGRSPDEILAGLRLLADELGHSPTAKEILIGGQQRICASIPTYLRHFGNLDRAREAAGLDPVKKHPGGIRPVRPSGNPPSGPRSRADRQREREAGRAIARERCLEDLRRLAAELGRPPTFADVIEGAGRGVCSHPASYRRQFGGIRTARQAAGLGHPNAGEKFKYLRPPSSLARDPEAKREFLLQELRELAAQLGRQPSNTDLLVAARRGLCSYPEIYRKIFGSLKEARGAGA